MDMGFIIAGTIIIVLALFVLIFSFVTYKIAFFSNRKQKEDYYFFPESEDFASAKGVMTPLIDEIVALPFEDVEITSFDGLKLKARYYHVKDGAPLQIQFHGYKGMAYRDFCGGNKLARLRGHNSLLIDHRAHGRSEGKTISFGINERRDCLAWVNYAVERFGENVEIYLSGVSMGATTVLMASGLDLPKNVKGIIADCPFSSPEDIIKKTTKDMGFPPNLAFPFIVLGAKLYGKFNLKETTACDAVKNAKVPILLVHGDADTNVPVTQSDKIYKSNPDRITYEVFPGAGHAMCYVTDNERYVKVVDDFFARV